MKSLRSSLFALLLMLCSILVIAQERQAFEYNKSNDSTRQFKNLSYRITFGNYVRTEDGIKVRRVSVNEDVFLMTVKDSKAGLVQRISDPNGNTLATVFLNGSKKNTVIAGALQLKWKDLDKHSWIYLSNDKEVLRCSYQYQNNIHEVALTFDTSLPFVVQLAALERSLDNIRFHDYNGKERGVEVGVKGGINFSILSASINSESQFRSGVNLGLYLKVPIGKHEFFRPEIYYSSQGQKDNYKYSTGLDAGKTTTTLDYINIPLLFEFGKTITLQVGPQIGALLSAREKGTIAKQSVDDDLKSFSSKFDFSLVAGMGANITRGLSMGVRYNYGLVDIFKDPDAYTPGLVLPDVQNRVFHFYVAHSF